MLAILTLIACAAVIIYQYQCISILNEEKEQQSEMIMAMATELEQLGSKNVKVVYAQD